MTRHFLVTEACFCDGNLFSDRNLLACFFSDRNILSKADIFFVIEIFFCDGNFLAVTEQNFGDRNVFFWPKLRQKLVFVSKTSFYDGNFFSEGIFFWYSFSDRSLFLWLWFVSVTVTCVCDKTCSVKKIFFCAFYLWFPGKSFREKWEFLLSWIPNLSTLWSPARRSRPSCHSYWWSPGRPRGNPVWLG